VMRDFAALNMSRTLIAQGQRGRFAGMDGDVSHLYKLGLFLRFPKHDLQEFTMSFNTFLQFRIPYILKITTHLSVYLCGSSGGTMCY